MSTHSRLRVNTITFKNTLVDVNAVAFRGAYGLTGAGFVLPTDLEPVKTVTLVPGVNRYLFAIENSQFWFDVDGFGNVSNNFNSPNVNTDSMDIDNLAMPNPTITFKNTEVQVDPAGYLESYNLGVLPGFESGPVTGTVVPGVVHYRISIASSVIFFDVLADGSVTSDNMIR